MYSQMAKQRFFKAKSKRNVATQLTREGDEIKELAFLEEKDKCAPDLQEPLPTFSDHTQVFEEDYLALLDNKALNYLHSENSAAIARAVKTLLFMMLICFDMLIGSIW